jgi:hypothetical protein
MERQPLSVNVADGVVTVAFNVECFGLTSVNGVTVAPADETNFSTLTEGFDFVFAVGVAGKRKADESAE